MHQLTRKNIFRSWQENWSKLQSTIDNLAYQYDHEILGTVSGLPIELEVEICLESRTHSCSQA